MRIRHVYTRMNFWVGNFPPQSANFC
uniref:Uncharacterized protein n=1 Tax=Rhizophora mucronata TaxID=61149 RepID=A0A2P2R0G2_RHIMU